MKKAKEEKVQAMKKRRKEQMEKEAKIALDAAQAAARAQAAADSRRALQKPRKLLLRRGLKVPKRKSCGKLQRDQQKRHAVKRKKQRRLSWHNAKK